MLRRKKSVTGRRMLPGVNEKASAKAEIHRRGRLPMA
jgi:hypothetical protein